MGRIICSVSVSPELHKKAKENFIPLSEATRVGIGVMLAERGVDDYDGSLNLHRRMIKFKTIAEEALQKLSELEIKDNNKKILENKKDGISC